MLPLVARAFAELGYRRATTAALAARCGVRENVLYRAWPSKKAMFIASIRSVWENTLAEWEPFLQSRASDPDAVTEQILLHEAEHPSPVRLHRLVFAGLSEVDDPEIAGALRDMYLGFQSFIAQRLTRPRASKRRAAPRPDTQASLAAWALIGLATIASIGRELELLTSRRRRELYQRIGRLLLKGHAT